MSRARTGAGSHPEVDVGLGQIGEGPRGYREHVFDVPVAFHGADSHIEGALSVARSQGYQRLDFMELQ